MYLFVDNSEFDSGPKDGAMLCSTCRKTDHLSRACGEVEVTSSLASEVEEIVLPVATQPIPS